MPNLSSQPRYVLITGASSGIGRRCAEHLDQQGFHVLAGVRRAEDMAELAATGSSRLRAIRLDVTDASSIQAAADEARRTTGGGLYALVNNAGIAVAGPLEFLPLDAVRLQLEVNVLGALAVTQAFLPLLRDGGGRVVNMGSVSGITAFPFLGPYAASKFALKALSDSLRGELRMWRIPVVLIEPGRIVTTIYDKSLQAADRYKRQLPAQAFELYGQSIERFEQLADKSSRTGSPPQVVAQAVARALTAGRPRTCYRIGKDALMVQALGWLPNRCRDWLIARRLRFRPGRGTIGPNQHGG